MNRSIIKHEFKMVWNSRKNILFIIALISIILSYCFIILPSSETIDSFDAESLERTMKDLDIVQKGKKERGDTGFSPMSGYAVYAANERDYLIKNKLLTSFEDQNYHRFLQFRLKDSQLFYDAIEREFSSPGMYRSQDINHTYTKASERYMALLNNNFPITYEMIEQKTALQTIQMFLLGTAGLLIIFCAIYFSSDMLVKDRQNQSVLQGLPISWYRLINLKSVVVFIYTLLILTGLIAFATLILTPLNGLGSLKIPLVTTLPGEGGVFGFDLHSYDTMTLGHFLLRVFAFLPIIIYLFIRINAFLSLLLKNTWAVLMVSSAFLFSEFIYFSRTKSELFGLDMSNFPQTYFDIGNILTGEKNYLLKLDTMTYTKGLFILAMSIIIIEILLFIVSRIVTKRRFYQGV